MNSKAFNEIIMNTPVYMAVFKITKPPSWCSDALKKGDEIFLDKFGTFRPVDRPGGYGLPLYCMKFSEYRLVEKSYIRNLLI